MPHEQPLPECVERFRHIDAALTDIKGHSEKIAIMSVQLKWIMGILVFIASETALMIFGFITKVITP